MDKSSKKQSGKETLEKHKENLELEEIALRIMLNHRRTREGFTEIYRQLYNISRSIRIIEETLIDIKIDSYFVNTPPS